MGIVVVSFYVLFEIFWVSSQFLGPLSAAAALRKISG